MSIHEDDTTNDESITNEGAQSGEDDNIESNSVCMICQEEWTLVSEHRICCLKCGHIFGKSCITKWISQQGSNAKCPLCQKSARKADIRVLWCKAIKATDNSDLRDLQNQLDLEKKERKNHQAMLFHKSLQNEMLHGEMERLKQSIINKDSRIKKMEIMLMKFNRVFQAQRANGVVLTGDEGEELELDSTLITQIDSEVNMEADESVVVQPRELKGKFYFADKIESCRTGGCKAFAICPTTPIILVAQPCPQTSGANIFGAYGLRKFQVMDTNVREMIPLHSQEINSIKLKPVSDLILTSSQDKKIKITSITNNTCIQEYQSQFDPLCVAWSAHRDQQFYVASTNCYVTLYDMRNTQEYIYQSDQRVAKTRAMSIAAAASESLQGLLFNDIRSCQFLETSENSNYDLETIDRSVAHLTSHSLPFAGSMSTVDFCKRLDMTLISTKTSPQNRNAAHNLVKLSKIQQDDGTSAVECKSIKTFSGRGPCELVSQSRILRHPTLEDHVLVGATDTASKGLMIWDSSDNSEYQTIKEPEFARDILMYSPENSNQHILYTLNDKGLNIYKWDFA